MRSLPIRVMKVGGSLFDFENLPRALIGWLETQTPARNVVLAGGGVWVDCLRVADHRFHLGEPTSHALGLELMNVTAQLLAAIVKTHCPNQASRFLPTWEELQDALQPLGGDDLLFLNAAACMDRGDGRSQGSPLPASWSVTSDSIAAYVAATLAADELVLLKSGSLSAGATREDAMAAGFVDACFAQASTSLPRVRCVNLRDPNWGEVTLV